MATQNFRLTSIVDIEIIENKRAKLFANKYIFAWDIAQLNCLNKIDFDLSIISEDRTVNFILEGSVLFLALSNCLVDKEGCLQKIENALFHATSSVVSLSETLKLIADEIAQINDNKSRGILSGCVYLVMGGAGGIGGGVVKECIAEGACLVVLDTCQRRLDLLQSRLVGGNVRYVCGDASDESSICNAIKLAVTFYGRLDGFVSCLGRGDTKWLHQLDLSEFSDNIFANVTSNFYVVKHVLNHLMIQNQGGSIVFIASKTAVSPGRGFGAYAISKAALLQMSRVIAIGYGKYKIRSNVVNPGAVFEESSFWTDEILKERSGFHSVDPNNLPEFFSDRALLKEPVTPRDVACSVVFFLSDKSSKTTGSFLSVDSGDDSAFAR